MGSIGSKQATNSTNYISDEFIRERLEDYGYEFTDVPEEAIYILKNGDMVSGAFYGGQRGEDHRLIESVFDDMDRYTEDFWKQMFNRTGLLMLIPETKEALTSTDVSLTKEQKQILSRLGYKLTKE